MTAPDSSLLVSGADPDHPLFEAADPALAEVREGGRLVSHTIAETYSTLTGPDFGLPIKGVAAYLAPYLTRAPVGIAPDRYPAAIEELGEAGVIGGAVYDGLIALSARDAGLRLVTLDRRARPTYERCGVEYTLLLDD